MLEEKRPMNELHLPYYRPLMDYIEFWNRLSTRSIGLLDAHADHSIRFQDPFHDLAGIHAVKEMLENRFTAITDLKYKLTNYAWAEKGGGNCAYLHWQLAGIVRKSKINVIGISEVTFTPEGRVFSHIDYWHPSQNFYAQKSLWGRAFTYIKEKLSL